MLCGFDETFNFIGEFFDKAVGIFSGRPALENSISGAAGDDMKMEMFDELAGTAAVVVEDIVTLGIDGGDNGPGDFAEGPGQSLGEFGGTLIKTIIMLFRDDKAVSLADGSNIKKRQDQFILIYFTTRDITLYNPAEDAIFRHD